MKFARFLLSAVLLIGLLAFGLDQVATHLGTTAAVGVALVGLTLGSPAITHQLGVVTAISNLWVPDIWISGAAERSTTRPSLITSGITVRDPQITEAASGGGTQAQVPFIRDPNFDDEIQVESTAPGINNLSSGKQVAPILNRVSALGASALSGAVSASDPVGFILNSVADLRLRQRQKTLLNVLRGVFGNSAAPGAGTAALKSLRHDIFLEAGATATSANLFSSDAFIDATAKLGEMKDKLLRGAIVCHSVIEAAMLKQDDIAYIRDSQGQLVMRTYKGIPLFVSDLLTRAGGTSGSVYDTYIFAPGAVATGDKPQSSRVGDVASLLLDGDPAKNDEVLYDRTRFILHVQGTKWVGTPAGQSATNAELATAGNWELAFADAKNAGVVCLRTNG